MEIENASLSQLIRWWSGEEIPDWAEGSVLIREKIASALLRTSEGVSFLKSRLESNDLTERAKALWFLCRKEICDEEIIEYLIDAFRKTLGVEQQAAIAFKQIALEGFVCIDQYPLDRSEVEELFDCESKDVAASAMVYLSHAYQEEAVTMLKFGLQSDNPYMRAKACTEAGFRGILELKDEVKALLNDRDRFVANAAQIGCEVFDFSAWERRRT